MGLSLAREIWRKWGLEVMVILCLADQILLAIFARSRRTRFRNWLIKFLVWLLYSSLDGLSIYTLGMISFRLGVISVQSGSPNEKRELIAFWAPILVVFLGGPDTISALSLEDNELWKRQLLIVASQIVVAWNIIILARLPTYLKCLAIIMSLVAAIKCFEKIWVLWNASSEKLRKSMHSPNPGLSYPRFMEQYTLRQLEGYRVRLHEIVEVNPEPTDVLADRAHVRDYIVLANALFPGFRRLFADLILSYDDTDASIGIFRSIDSANDAFRVVEIELHSMYELLHTKAEWLYRLKGFLARSATFLLTLGVFIAFVFFSDGGRSKHYKFDRILTIELLLALSVQEFSTLYEAAYRYSHATSGWHWHCTQAFVPIITRIIPLVRWSEKPRWSNSVGQFSLLKFFIREGTHWPVFGKLLGAFDLEKSWYTSYEDISDSLKSSLHSTLKELFESKSTGIAGSNQVPEEISQVLEMNHAGDLTWSAPSTVGETSGAVMEFDNSILIWHIATELCYHDDTAVHAEAGEATVRNRQLSQTLSRYMAYLLVNYPFMLPDGISHIRIRDTDADACRFFDGTENLAQACEKILRVKTEVEPHRVVGNISKSVLFEATRLASALRNHEIKERIGSHEFLEWKWKLIVNVWFQFIIFTAKKSRGRDHAKQLSNGGELLTQVWMMMAHFGLTDHFQMGRGTVMDRLVLE